MNWMEIHITRAGDKLRIAGRGSDNGEWTPERALPRDARDYLVFSRYVQHAAKHKIPLSEPLLEHAKELYNELFREELGELFTRLRPDAKDAQNKLLLRFRVEPGELDAIPWEAACDPKFPGGFLACAGDLVVARAAFSRHRFEERVLDDTLRILQIFARDAPAEEWSLREVLAPHINAGEVELLRPIAGVDACLPRLLEKLGMYPRAPHVLHFFGHGGFDNAGRPLLMLPGEQNSLAVGAFTNVLRAKFGFKDLRLVYLQSCSGGIASPQESDHPISPSAASLLISGGVDAVVAHLWPTKASTAHKTALAFYRKLVNSGDVCESIQDARLQFVASNERAQGFSPTLYIHGTATRLFNLSKRVLRPPVNPRMQAPVDISDLEEALDHISTREFSLIVGAHWEDETLDELRDALRASLLENLEEERQPKDINQAVHALAQHYVLHVEPDAPTPDELLADIIDHQNSNFRIPTVISAAASWIQPGVHTTLLLLPLLEHELARVRGDRTIYVIQPMPPGARQRKRYRIVVRPGGTQRWIELRRGGRRRRNEGGYPPKLDLKRDFVILRLYGGRSSDDRTTNAMLTEDEHIQGLLDLRGFFPADWTSEIFGWLQYRPALCMGVSALDWRHRMLLRRLYNESAPVPGSLAVLARGQYEDVIWEASGAGFSGESNFRVVHADPDELAHIIRRMPR